MDKEELNLQLVELTSNIAVIETRLQAYKELTKQYDEFRAKLYEMMIEHNIDKYISPEGIQFTIVKGSPQKIELTLQFNEEKFKNEEPILYKKYMEAVEKTTKARNSYLRITLPIE